jgi:hypothetical protein
MEGDVSELGQELMRWFTMASCLAPPFLQVPHQGIPRHPRQLNPIVNNFRTTRMFLKTVDAPAVAWGGGGGGWVFLRFFYKNIFLKKNRKK